MNSRLNIVIAHTLEAKFPVQWLGLQQVGDKPGLYSDGNGVNLVVSGEGQSCSSNAVDYLASKTDESLPTAWLNFGIAGHQSLPLGAVMAPDSIRQASSGHRIYPAPMLNIEHRGLLITVDEPELKYPEKAAYDMEGFAFWNAAVKHSSVELVHCVKIVSDNKELPAQKLDLKKVESILKSSESVFLDVVGQIQSLLAQCPQQFPYSDLYAELLSLTQFSVTQQAQLKRLLQRYHALNLYEELQRLGTKHESARSCISALENGLSGKF